jgi:hypothetical protein
MRDPRHEAVGQILVASAMISWISWIGLFIFLNWSAFPWIAEWLKILRH